MRAAQLAGILAVSAASVAHAFAPGGLAVGLRASRGEAALSGRGPRGLRMAGARREENAPGNLFVDESCINCDTCRWMSPCFTQVNGKSAVTTQPDDDDDDALFAAFQAMSSCPTGSIRMETPDPGWQPLVYDALRSFPSPIYEATEGIYHAGFHSKKSFGAASYFVHRADQGKGNILVDSPRYFEPLARQMEEMGGVEYMYLTHVDDIADHERWAEKLGCKRIIHEREVERSESLKNVEMVLEGDGPWQIDDDLKIVLTAGHTKGHTVLIYKEEAAFTGDHLAKTLRAGHLAAFRRQTWWSWEEQIKSMEALREEKFISVLPGHGRRLITSSYDEMRKEMDGCIEWMKQNA